MSPFLLERSGVKFRFHSREGAERPHVHVTRGDSTAKFWLEPVRLAESRGFQTGQLTRIEAIVREEQQFFLRRWDEYFAQFPPQQTRRRPEGE